MYVTYLESEHYIHIDYEYITRGKCEARDPARAGRSAAGVRQIIKFFCARIPGARAAAAQRTHTHLQWSTSKDKKQVDEQPLHIILYLL